MFRRLEHPPARTVTLIVGDEPLPAAADDTVAAALLAAGRPRFGRAPVSGAPRGPFCLMGSCQQCLVVVDGMRDQRACMTPVRDGMRVEPQDEPVVAAGRHGDDPWGVDE